MPYAARTKKVYLLIMKYFSTFFWLLLLFPFQLFAQPALTTGNDITGLWQGYVKTAQKQLPYELVIAEKDGKIMAYSLTTFTVNDEEIISIKTMKIAFQKERIVIEDDDMLFNTFTSESAKKIKQTNTLIFGEEGLQHTLTGTFETKTNRALRPASGNVYLIKKEDPAEIKLMAKLEEMKLTGSLSFSPKKQVQVSSAPSVAASTLVPPSSLKKEETIEPVIPEVYISIKPLPFKAGQRINYTRQKNSTYTVTRAKPLSTITIAAIAKTIPATIVAAKQVVAVKPAVAAKAPATVPVRTSVESVAKKTAVVTQSTVVVKAAPKNIEVAPAIDLAKRRIETIEQLYIESDSLVLTLYDNGEVDGDSVSIILNGKTIVSQQRLSTTAFTKTIYITPELGDTIQLVMYAENLGTLPPNTGLLLLQFDNKRHEIRFSGDLNKNAAITLRRKKEN